MVIFEMKAVNQEIFDAFQRLIPQLTSVNPPPLWEALAKMAASPATFVFLARHPNSQGKIVGTATLATLLSPTGLHGWIEDVVVDEAARRSGIGKVLTETCIVKARELGLQEVQLTSRTSREVANKLYISMGFARRETNLYRLALDD